MSLEARFWALRLVEGVDREEEEGEEGEGGEISPMCESIGHRPLRGRCPKITIMRSNQFCVEKKIQTHSRIVNDLHVHFFIYISTVKSRDNGC